MKISLGKSGRKNRAKNVHIDDFDCWNLDYTLASIIHPALIRMKEIKQGYPELYTEGEWEQSRMSNQLAFDFVDYDAEDKMLEDRWNDALDKMIYSFGVLADDDSWTWDLDYPQIQEGLDLFAKHYHSLWD